MTAAASLASMARALGGDVVGRQILAPGPGHSRRDRSMCVKLCSTAPEGFVVHSHAGDDPLQCRDHVRAHLGWQRPTRFGNDRRPAAPPPQNRAPIEPDRDQAAKIERARAIWDAARDPRGTVVEAYLRSRGLELPDEVAGEAIRYLERCPWHDPKAGRTIFVPAMVAAMRSIETEEITAAHRTRLTPDGKKVDRRMLGKASGAAIMLCPFSAVGAGLTIGEGIETSLSAWQLGWRNTWALGSVGALGAFPVLAGVQTLTLLVETDDSGASSKAIGTVGSRYADAEREVLLVTPTIAGDLNDVVQRGAAA